MKTDRPAYVYLRNGYLYFERRGIRVRMHHKPGTREFAAEYALALAGQPKARNTSRTMAGLVERYKLSDRYTKLADRTKKDYQPALEHIVKIWGDVDPGKLRRTHFATMIETKKARAKFARDLLAVSSVLMRQAWEMGWRDDNPVQGMSRPQTPADRRLDRQPWPQDLIEKFREAAPLGTVERLVFELCLGTGQRIGDVLRMRWGDIEGNGINVRQSKTGAVLWIPFTATLADCLGQTRKQGLSIVAGRFGQRYSYTRIAARVLDTRRAIGAEAYDIHGLRHTAASELAAAGCSNELIQAVTGHKSAAMVHRYSAKAAQRARATKAQSKRT